MKKQKEAGSTCKLLVTPAKYVQQFTPSKHKKANLHTKQNQNNLLYIYLEIETGSPGETSPSPGAREKVGLCKQAWRTEGTQRE